INMNGKGVDPASSGNFVGFYDTLGDLLSKITNPINGKSFAYVKDSKLGGNYYTAYWYVSNNWTELKQDPALIYTSPSAPTPSGVFSIKPNPAITIDATGQLNLDGLATPQLPSHFKGFFNSIEELKTAVPNPVLHQDWAYVKVPTGWMAYRSDSQGSARKWNVIAPMGSFAVINRKDEPNSYSQSFGIYKNDSWDLDDKGILSLKPVDTTTNVVISSQEGTTTGGKISNIKFESGKPYAEVNLSTLTIKSPQQVIDYNSAWESAHKLEDYRGSLFYDTASRTWMGCNDPDAGGAVDVKWTKLMHRGMSDQVKSLVRRVPAKAPNVDPGILGDSGLWHFNGVSFLDKEDSQLPEEFREKCGGYITTTVQDKDAPNISIPQQRLQTCTPDNEEGGTWVRRFISTGSPGAEASWSKWVRTSFSPKDIEDHENNPAAHKNVIKHYRVFALNGRYLSIAAQTAGSALGGIHASNVNTIADNYGFSNEEKDYIDTPYEGSFRMGGVISLGGYKEGEKRFPSGNWQLILRKKDIDSQNYSPIAQFRYNHTDEKVQYPSMSFEVENVDLKTAQELVANLTFTDNQGIRDHHPDLYLVPTRSTLFIEDMKTRGGSYIGNTHRTLYGNLDVIGNVGIKSHHSRLNDDNSSIRVYGEKVNKTPVKMSSH
ncbi:MAG: hypothetical protein ACRC6V_09875, partial [Bacteroidales bacterium]